MIKRLLPVFGVLLWAVATFGILQLQSIPGEITHNVCGVWGCYPPLQALIAWHGFLMMLAVPMLAYLIDALSRKWLRRLGAALLGFAAVTLVVITMWQMSEWYPHVTEADRRYLPQRVLYVATQRDVPVAQVILAGVVCYVAAFMKRPGDRREHSQKFVNY